MAKKNIRSSQIITTFGVGQIVNFPNDVSIIVAGLSEWDKVLDRHRDLSGPQSIDLSKLVIREPRLEQVLGVEKFLKPFAYNTTGTTNKQLEMPCFRFPGWHYCTSCGSMFEVKRDEQDDKIACINSNCHSRMIPIRFVAACSSGHLQDIPFFEWVHNGRAFDQGHKLSYFSTGGSGDLSSIIIKCSCGMQRSLAGLMSVQKENGIVYNSPLASIGLSTDEEFSIDNPNNNNPYGCYCKGHKPWLDTDGANSTSSCGNHLEVLIRGGSNVHYSFITSSIFIPDFSIDTNPIAASIINDIGVERLRKLYDLDVEKEMIRLTLETRPEVTRNLISIDHLLMEVEKVLKTNNESDYDTVALTELDLRIQEHKVIISGHDAENGDLKAVVKDLSNYIDSNYLKKYFQSVVLVERLKETRVFTGFARINKSNKIRTEDLSDKAVKWLPASEVYGEGIFIEFSHSLIESWKVQYSKDFERLIKNYERSNSARGPITKYSEIKPEFVLIHTFSHLLIKRLCFSCGYGSSSLRERIYFSDDDYKMYGVLIYTSSGDSDGSLGGLVRQGGERYFGKLVKEAIEEARWCSGDPVCSVIGQESGQGPDNVNGSACHNCCLLSETSCENFNALLDRATIIGTPEKSSLGFFNF
jgi:hypothetical protein